MVHLAGCRQSRGRSRPLLRREAVEVGGPAAPAGHGRCRLHRAREAGGSCCVCWRDLRKGQRRRQSGGGIALEARQGRGAAHEGAKVILLALGRMQR